MTTLRVAVGNNFSCNDDSSAELSVVAGKKVTTSSRFEHTKYRLDCAAIYWKRDDEIVCICFIKPPVALQEAIHHQPQQVPCLTGKTTIYHHFCLTYSSVTEILCTPETITIIIFLLLPGRLPNLVFYYYYYAAVKTFVCYIQLK